GHFDGEANEEQPEHPPLQVERNLGAQQLDEIETVEAELHEVLEVEDQNAEEHQHAADQRIHDELHRRVLPALAAPDGDDEIHRHQHGLPENEEEQEIERHEDAQHGGLQEQEEGVVFLEAVLNSAPAREDGDQAEQGGEHHQEQAEAVDPQMVRCADGGNPRRLLDELEVPGAVEEEDQGEGNREAEDSGAIRHNLMARAFDD